MFSAKIYTTAVPEKGKANKVVIKLLANFFSLPLSSIRLIKGFTSPYKVIDVDLSEKALESFVNDEERLLW